MISYIFLCLFIFLIFPVNILSQTFGDQKIISSDLVMAYRCFAADLDTDGDLDAISLSSEKIAWYENTDGKASFGSGKLLSNLIGGGGGLYACPLDTNSYMDILWVSPLHYGIYCLYNIQGNAEFSSLDSIAIGPPLPDHPNAVYASDLDNDGDLDIILGDRDLYWSENLDGLYSFSPLKYVSQPGQVQTVYGVFAADIDGDDDMDVLSASINDDKITWYENTNGAGTFEQHIITTQADGAESVYAADLDADGDIDVLSASSEDGKIAWYENLNGTGTFGTRKIVSDSLPGAGWIFAVDIDNDDDPDIVSSSGLVYKIVWYENVDSQGTFSGQNIIDSPQYGPSCIYPADLDGDGDKDILATILNNKLVWYENLTNPTSIQDKKSANLHDFHLFQNYPNPFNSSTTIQYQIPLSGGVRGGLSHVRLSIYNLLGQKVAILVNGRQTAGKHQIKWHANGLPSGIYLAQLQAGPQTKTIKLLLQK